MSTSITIKIITKIVNINLVDNTSLKTWFTSLLSSLINAILFTADKENPY